MFSSWLGSKSEAEADDQDNATSSSGFGSIGKQLTDRALGDLSKEQEAFVRSKHSLGKDAALPPWVGAENEEELKQQILNLSGDRRNVIRDPPPGANFHFEFATSFPIAQAILPEDERLNQLRFELVPKTLSEEDFWRNYFYRVTLLKQSAVLVSDTSDSPEKDKPSAEEPQDNEEHQQPEEPEPDFADDLADESEHEEVIENDDINLSELGGSLERNSDDGEPSAEAEEEETSVEAKAKPDAEEWDSDFEKELETDLNDYANEDDLNDVANDDDDDDLERELAEMLKEDL